ncbi:DEAD/DEAH box helicase [Candidatus Woesearchaeota archaeon]|nr:DEAD/DEAH box helicase [Candidatus Woesearchaeota archaeon]
MLKDFVPRLYQETILGAASEKNTLVVLPTGLGKTAIALLLACQRLARFPNSKIVFLGPTKPLVEQHLHYFLQHLDLPEEKFAVFTGMVAPEQREALWKRTQLIFSTPQGMENDMISRRISLEDVSLMIFDEAHRAVGNYAYAFIAKQYEQQARFPRILGITASPGAELETIKEVMQNLLVEHIEVRTHDDPDVKPYVQDIDVQWVTVELPAEFLQIKKVLDEALAERLQRLKQWGALKRTDLSMIRKKDLMMLQGQLQVQIAKGERDFVVFTELSVLAEVLKLEHGSDLLETQGITALLRYFERLKGQSVSTKTKAVKNVVSDPHFRSAWILASRLQEQGIEHPKLERLRQIVEEEMKAGAKMIVFSQYRDSAVVIERALNAIAGVQAKLFVGQLKKMDTGLSQKEQLARLQEFRDGAFNILVATAVGEEGLDIPSVELVVFYEPVPSAIRSIQRRGRTGRLEKGRVIILSASKTRDEGHKWSAHHKEKKMYMHLRKLKEHAPLLRKERSLQEFAGKDVLIFADHREKASGVIKELLSLGVDLKLEQLSCADYVLSSRVAVEYKSRSDFVDSIVDGRLLQQLKEMKAQYQIPVVMIEGEEDWYSLRNVHPNAIRGMIATIAVSYQIPLVYTSNQKESAAFLLAIAKREQEERKETFTPHAEKKVMSLKEQQEYLISALPGIGMSLAKPLLRQFKTVKGIINASAEELEQVEKIGEKKAAAIRDVVEREYEDT